MESKKRVLVGGDYLEITPIGGGGEVGRSCILLSFKGKKIMVSFFFFFSSFFDSFFLSLVGLWDPPSIYRSGRVALL